MSTEPLLRSAAPLLRSAAPRQILAEATTVLEHAGVPNAAADARALAAFVLQVVPTRLVLAQALTPAQRAHLGELVRARARRVPLQYLTGEAWFRHVRLAVGPGVFIPRPETEVLVGWGLNAVTTVPVPVVVDLCSGSGAIARSVTDERPDAIVYAIERDPAALAWLSRNCVGTDIHVVEGDAADPTVLADLAGTVDLVLCNPPYVASGSPVAPEVLADPPRAVFAGPTGLEIINLLIAHVASMLRPHGVVAIEHAETQGDAVCDVMRGTGRFDQVSCHPDLTGRPRFSAGRRVADERRVVGTNRAATGAATGAGVCGVGATEATP